MSNLYENMEYITPIKYIYSTVIVEYDISKANVNALYQAGIIDNYKYNYLCCLPKKDREKTVGLMILRDKDNIVYPAISRGIIDAKRSLFVKNDLKDNEIIRIANDAVYVMRSKPLTYTDFGMMKFIPKNRYTSFLKLGRLVFLYSSTMEDINIDIIGLSTENMEMHSDMISFIANLLQLVESSTIDVVMNYFNGFYNLYINKILTISYYRELNEDSWYTIKMAPKKMAYKISFAKESDKDKIDISYNASLLRELYSTIISIYRPK